MNYPKTYERFLEILDSDLDMPRSMARRIVNLGRLHEIKPKMVQQMYFPIYVRYFMGDWREQELCALLGLYNPIS